MHPFFIQAHSYNSLKTVFLKLQIYFIENKFSRTLGSMFINPSLKKYYHTILKVKTIKYSI